MPDDRKIYAMSEEALAMVVTRVGGTGPEGPGIDARVAKLEASVDHIHADIKDIKEEVRDIRRVHDRDFRILFGAIVTTTLGLAAVLAKGFHWL